MPDLSDVSLIIKTFEREDALRRLLRSIRECGYDGCPVLIADDSRTPYRDAILADFDDIVDRYLRLPFDSGVSRGRNALLEEVETPYFVINDDDFVYDERTDLAWMLDQLQTADLDILGGLVHEPRFPESLDWTAPIESLRRIYRRLTGPSGEISRDWRGRLDRSGSTLRLEKSNDWTPPFVRCDFTLQFFLARTAPLRDSVGGWAEELKCFGEHWEFFYRVKRAGLEVAFTQEVGVRHVPRSNPDYDAHRYAREEEDMRKALDLHDLDVIEFHRPGGVRRFES